MPDALATYLLLCGAAFAAGMVNTLAGGGTLLTFPALVAALAGVPAADKIANMTSTLALVPGSVAGAWGFRRSLSGNAHWLRLLLPPSIAGGIVGALLLARLPNDYFRLVIPWLLLLATLLFLFQGHIGRRLATHQADGSAPSARFRAGVLVFQFLVAVYGGYFGAGIGILMLSSLGLMGVGDLQRMNAIKNWLAVSINGISAVIFMIDGNIHWAYAAAMAAAAIAGGFTGAHLGQRLPKAVVRGFIIAVGFVLTAWFFVKYYGPAAA